MKHFRTALIGGGLCGGWLASSALVGLEATDAVERNWPQWRGPLATGVAPRADPPVTWSETENVRWKVGVPGQGSSTPIVWNDLVFILTAIPEPPEPGTVPRPAASGFGGSTIAEGLVQRFTVLAYDRATGNVRWQHSPRTQVPHEGHHRDHGYASASPITDGEHLVVHFGSFGTYGYDLEGRLLWETDLGDMQTRSSFGEGSSPALRGNTVIILWDHEGPDFVVALDKRNGRELWRRERDEPTGWSTPLIVDHEGRSQVVVNGTNRVRSYDLATGELLWESGGQTLNAIPTPVAGQGMVYVTSGFRGNALQAIPLGSRGDLTDSGGLAWSFNRYTPYVPSPLLYGGLLYLHSGNNAQLSILTAQTGERHLEADRLDGMRGVYASPVGAAGRVIMLGRDGGALVIRHAPRLEVLATNRLDDGFDASPALVDREMFLRGREFLYCIAAER
jgi:outer membrane protein assembly factor BamB